MRSSQSVPVSFLYNLYSPVFKLIFITLSFYCSMYTKSACIIIHGTWAKNEKWYRPGGDFFEAVKICNDEIKRVDKVVSFSWSGKLGYPAQIEAAQNLVAVLNLYDSVILIAHSHGATIGMIASQIMHSSDTDRNNLGKIEQFYILGAPIRESSIKPNMHVIKNIYNMFSFGDLVQAVNGSYDRTFSACDNIANIDIMLNDLALGHSQLHSPAIGIWLLKIERFFAEKQIGNFELFDFSRPALVSFFSQTHPVYSVQENQNMLLACDKKMYELAKYAFFRRAKKL